MPFLRKHWFDLGGVLALGLGAWLAAHYRTWPAFTLLGWLNLLALLLHQVEEYRWPGYFPGMLNRTLYASPTPDRYPLNPPTALLINVGVGWGSYLAAAIAGPRLPWLSLAALTVSAGNVVAHTLLFNLKGRTWYNPGQATAWLLFAPLLGWLGYLAARQPVATPGQWALGVALGAALNYLGVLKLIDWLADPQSPYRFEARQLLPGSPAARWVAPPSSINSQKFR